MKPSLKKSIIFALVILQCTNVAYSQQQQQQQQQDQASGNVISAQQESQQATSNVPAATSAPAETTTTPPPAVTTTPEATLTTTTEAPKPTSDATVAPTSTTNPVAPTSDAAVPTSDAGNTTPSQSNNVPQQSSSNNNNNNVTSNGTVGPSASTPSDAAQATASNAPPKADPGSSSNKTAIIAGSVVGGLVGIALIAGLLTWMNRRGGCTSRTRRRDVQEDFSNENDYKMTDNNVGLGAAAAAGAMHSSDNLPPPSPFQHARRFVPPTSNPTGYMNLQDEEYGYHQNANVGAGYQAQQYQDYNAGVYHDGSHPDYNQDYQQEYYNNGHNEYAAHDYSADGSVTGSNHGGYQQQAYYGHAPGTDVTSPTLVNSAVPAGDAYRQQMKPDQVEQKPNVA